MFKPKQFALLMFENIDNISLLLLVTKLSVLSITKYQQGFSWKLQINVISQMPNSDF